MTPERAERAQRVIGHVAGWYARKVWWIELPDLEQEAWKTACECDQKPIEDVDAWGGYVYRAVSNHLSRYCWRFSSPVSANKPGRTEMEGLLHTSFEAVAPCGVPGGPTEDPETELIKREAALLVPRRRHQLRRRIRALCAQRSSDSAVVMATVAVLVDGVKPNAAASVAGAPVRAVYALVEWTKHQAAWDGAACGLLRDIRSRRRDL